MDEVVTFTRIVPATETMFLIPSFPLSGAAIDLWFQQGQYYDSGAGGFGQVVTNYLSCSRASTAFAKTSAGALTSFGVNTLRITNQGLLVEDSRTNDILSSQDFTTTWSLVDVSISGGNAAPDGTSTAQKVIPNTNNTTHDFQQSIGIAAVNYTVSVFAQAAGYNFGNLELAIAGGAGGRYSINVNLATGAIVDTSTTGSPTVVAQNTEFYGSFVRMWITITATAGALFAQISPCPTATPTYSNSIPSYAGDGTSGVIFWGVQFEVGSFPSSYIPTSGTAVTRAADNITITGNAQTLIAAATASTVAQVDNGGGGSFAANVVDSNGTNMLGFNASNNALASLVATLATGNTANRTSQDKLGLAWDGTGRSLVLNGGTVATDASAQTPSATQHLGSTGAANFIYAYVERLTIWVTKLANATLQGFTNP